jgi:phosphatidylglycerol---prolipoprotein diacylglyceryl transferase
LQKVLAARRLFLLLTIFNPKILRGGKINISNNNFKSDMYPNLSYIFHDLFGTAPDNATHYVQTFGLFLALAFLTAAYVLYLELVRKKDEGLFTPHPTRDEKGNVKMAYPHERVGDMTMVAAISGLLGAKIFAIMESVENIQQFLSDPISTFFSGSGIAMYGGLIGGFIGVYWFITRKLNMNALYMMDAVAPALMFAYGVGRIGCQMSGDGDWGIAAAAQPEGWFLPSWMWAWDFPRNVLNAGVPIEGFTGHYRNHLPNPVYPTPFYEAVAAILLGFFLWALRKRVKTHGVIFMIYLIVNGIERFFIEKIRVNDKLHAFGKEFTQAELIAVILVIIGIAGCIILPRRAANNG